MVSQVIWLKKLRVILHCSSCAVFRTLQNHQQDSKKLKAHYRVTKVETPCHQWVHSCSAHMPLLRLEHCGAHFLISRPEFFWPSVRGWTLVQDKGQTGHLQNWKHQYFSLVLMFFQSDLCIIGTEYLLSVWVHPYQYPIMIRLDDMPILN